GHLIDSAANNQQRFVRGALEGNCEGPGYRQNDWVRIHGYQELKWDDLVTLWSLYNGLLVEVIARTPEEHFGAQCVVQGWGTHALDWVIEDYVRHMQHHLDHILGRETITPYR